VKLRVNSAAWRRKLEIRSSKLETIPNVRGGKFETASHLGNFHLSVIRTCFGFRISDFEFSRNIRSLFRISIFGFRNCGRLLPLALLFAALQFVTSAKAMMPDGGYSLVTAHSSIDGIDCITVDYVEEEPLQITDNSSELPDNPERDASVWEDKASTPARSEKDLPQLPGRSFDAATLPSLEIAPILLLGTHSFYCLHEHIRERAPPGLG